ncbi:MAG: hypothetical protein AAF628_14125 [Planctomycetota bacterium]
MPRLEHNPLPVFVYFGPWRLLEPEKALTPAAPQPPALPGAGEVLPAPAEPAEGEELFANPIPTAANPSQPQPAEPPPAEATPGDPDPAEAAAAALEEQQRQKFEEVLRLVSLLSINRWIAERRQQLAKFIDSWR